MWQPLDQSFEQADATSNVAVMPMDMTSIEVPLYLAAGLHSSTLKPLEALNTRDGSVAFVMCSKPSKEPRNALSPNLSRGTQNHHNTGLGDIQQAFRVLTLQSSTFVELTVYSK